MVAENITLIDIFPKYPLYLYGFEAIFFLVTGVIEPMERRKEK